MHCTIYCYAYISATIKNPNSKTFLFVIFYILLSCRKRYAGNNKKKQNFLQSLKIYNIANKKHKWMSPISDYIYVHLHWFVYQQKNTA